MSTAAGDKSEESRLDWVPAVPGADCKPRDSAFFPTFGCLEAILRGTTYRGWPDLKTRQQKERQDDERDAPG